MKIKYVVAGFLFVNCLLFHASAQQITIDETITGKNLPQINYVFNRIFGNINSFYEKLSDIKKPGNKPVRIVHVGDSHIQADLFTRVLRHSFQEIFGNAGRGLVFPYQLAGTNAPQDINSSSNVRWRTSKITRFEDDILPGISGYCIQTNRTDALIHITLDPNDYGEQTFDKLKLFPGNMDSLWEIKASYPDTEYIETNKSNLTYDIDLKNPASEFSLVSRDIPGEKSFYGVSLEKNQPGIIYHSIGVNGARYDQYNRDSLFWKQLPALEADIFIVSMGTNEAQSRNFDAAAFISEVLLFISNLKTASPGATVLITTPGDSYKGRYSNKILRQLNASLYDYCLENNIGIWDLYRVTNGYGSAQNWYRRGLLNRDRVHFTNEGYQLQARLLFIALMKGYNIYSSY